MSEHHSLSRMQVYFAVGVGILVAVALMYWAVRSVGHADIPSPERTARTPRNLNYRITIHKVIPGSSVGSTWMTACPDTSAWQIEWSYGNVEIFVNQRLAGRVSARVDYNEGGIYDDRIEFNDPFIFVAHQGDQVTMEYVDEDEYPTYRWTVFNHRIPDAKGMNDLLSNVYKMNWETVK